MKVINLLVATAAFGPLMSFAATHCQGISYKHSFTVSQKQNDVEVTLDDEKPVRYSDLQDPREGSLKLSGHTLTSVTIANTTVDEFLKKKSLARNLAVSMIAGRAEYDGDQDLWYSFASDLYASLKCQ
jgi:hypothetical protein